MKVVSALLAKDEAWLAARRGSLGGSDANILMGGDQAAILRLWQEKRGEAGLCWQCAKPIDACDCPNIERARKRSKERA